MCQSKSYSQNNVNERPYTLSIQLKIVIFIILSNISYSSGQSNLAFSRVVFLTDTSTVPAGKVWKVESVLQSSSNSWVTVTSGSNSYFSICGFFVNGVYTSALNYYRFFSSVSAGNGVAQSSTSTGFQGTNLPLWLPEGVKLGPASNSNGLSIIEFSINQ